MRHLCALISLRHKTAENKRKGDSAEMYGTFSFNVTWEL